MAAPTLPCLAELEDGLARAERDLIRADMIDSYTRRQAEMADAKRRIDYFTAEIARRRTV